MDIGVKFYSNVTIILISYLCIGIACLVKLTGVQQWFYELDSLWLTAIILVCFIFIELCGHHDSGYRLNYWIICKIIPMVLILILMDDTSFAILYESLWISELIMLLSIIWLVSIESTKSVKRQIVIHLLPFYGMLMGMFLEDVIKEIEVDDVYYIGYDTTTNLLGLIACYGYCLCSNKALLKWYQFEELDYSNPEMKDKQKNNWEIVSHAFIWHPIYYGLRMGVLFFFHYHGFASDIDVDMIAPNIKRDIESK